MTDRISATNVQNSQENLFTGTPSCSSHHPHKVQPLITTFFDLLYVRRPRQFSIENHHQEADRLFNFNYFPAYAEMMGVLRFINGSPVLYSSLSAAIYSHTQSAAG